jgi:hypothetical protein
VNTFQWPTTEHTVFAKPGQEMPVERPALLEQNFASVPGVEQHVFRLEFQRVMREFEKLYGQVKFAEVLSHVNPKTNWDGTFSIPPAQQYNIQAKQVGVAFGISACSQDGT